MFFCSLHFQTRWTNGKSTFSDQCDTARFLFGRSLFCVQKLLYLMNCMNKQQDGATSESSSNSTQYLTFGLNFWLLNIYLSCKLVVTCASSQYWQFCLFQDLENIFNLLLLILPFCHFPHFANYGIFHKVWLFLKELF